MTEPAMEQKHRNFYSAAMNDPEVLARRRQKNAEVEAKMQHMLQHNPGRAPSWDEHRIMQLDRYCLDNSKRCVMWDDEDGGFYLMLNWDWLANRPASPPDREAKLNPGWWVNISRVIQQPLLDPSVPEDQLAAWLDKHTMRTNQALLSSLCSIRKEGEKLVLDTDYGRRLQELDGSAGQQDQQSTVG